MTSPFLTPTQKERGEKKYLFSDTKKMPDLIVVPFKPFFVVGNQYEEYWNAEHLHVYAMFPSAPLKDRIQIVQKRWRDCQQEAKVGPCLVIFCWMRCSRN